MLNFRNLSRLTIHVSRIAGRTFEHPVRVVLLFKAYTIEVLLRHIGFSSAC